MKQWSKRHLPHRGRAWARRVLFAPLDLWTWAAGHTDPLVPPRGLLSVEGDFQAIGSRFVEHLVDHAGLTPRSSVLDIGCGPGRMAVPLTRHLEDGGSYDGLDVLPEAIAWCRRAISRRFPHFRFHLADVKNANYNRGGGTPADTYVFPFPDSAFDVIFLCSVFTHLDRPAVANYLREISRLLRPGGSCLATFFLVNEDSLLRRARWRPQMPHAFGGSLVADGLVPEVAIAHREADVRALYESANLRLVDPILWGSWSGRQEFVSYQDMVVARRDG